MCSIEKTSDKSPLTNLFPDSNNNKIVSGTQIISSTEIGHWYSSWQTETHSETSMFIPPLENATMIINIGNEEITVPLELSTTTEKIIK